MWMWHRKKREADAEAARLREHELQRELMKVPMPNPQESWKAVLKSEDSDSGQVSFADMSTEIFQNLGIQGMSDADCLRKKQYIHKIIDVADEFYDGQRYREALRIAGQHRRSKRASSNNNSDSSSDVIADSCNTCKTKDCGKSFIK
jgi:hypothetical protein